jgi:hypothetical protein
MKATYLFTGEVLIVFATVGTYTCVKTATGEFVPVAKALTTAMGTWQSFEAFLNFRTAFLNQKIPETALKLKPFYDRIDVLYKQINPQDTAIAGVRDHQTILLKQHDIYGKEWIRVCCKCKSETASGSDSDSPR